MTSSRSSGTSSPSAPNRSHSTVSTASCTARCWPSIHLTCSGSAGAAEPLDTTVTWRLVPEGTGTRLLITHDGFDDTDPAQQAAMKILGGGWQRHLARRMLSVLDDAAHEGGG